MKNPTFATAAEALDRAIEALGIPLKEDESLSRGADGGTRGYQSSIEGVDMAIYIAIAIDGEEVLYDFYGDLKATPEEAAAMIDTEVKMRLAEIHAAIVPR